MKLCLPTSILYIIFCPVHFCYSPLLTLSTHTTPHPNSISSHNLYFTYSNAKPKIADYAFTTVVPNLGVCDIDGKIDDMGKSLVLVDIPGLLEGAHDGVGLGLSFLRHVQRCR